MPDQSRHPAGQQSAAADNGFDERWLADSLRLMQQHARPADALSADQVSAAVTEARRSRHDPESRILYWAAVLSAQTQLPEAMAAWRQRGRMILALMLILAFVGGLSAALGVMGDGSRPVNVLWALGALLGVNLLMLLVWLASLGMTPGALSAGRVWFWLNARFYGRDALVLAQSFNNLNQRSGLTRWWLAAISHGFWSAAVTGALTGLLLALSLRSYAFMWETTILPAPVFNAAVQILGWLPSLAGFSLPDEATVSAAGHALSDNIGQTDAQRRVWAGWLCGAVVIYGLIPRLLLWLISRWRLLSGQRLLRLDVHSAEWADINQLLSPPSEVAGVTDPAPALTGQAKSRSADIPPGTGAPLVIGFELDEHMDWPGLPAGVERLLTGSREQRQTALRTLDQQAPRALLLVCDGAQTVDRGSLAWLADASGRVLHVAVWLAGNGSQARRDLWRQQLQTLGLTDALVFESQLDALRWLEDFV